MLKNGNLLLLLWMIDRRTDKVANIGITTKNCSLISKINFNPQWWLMKILITTISCWKVWTLLFWTSQSRFNNSTHNNWYANEWENVYVKLWGPHDLHDLQCSVSSCSNFNIIMNNLIYQNTKNLRIRQSLLVLCFICTLFSLFSLLWFVEIICTTNNAHISSVVIPLIILVRVLHHLFK